MADDRDRAQPEQDRAAGRVGVEFLAQPAERRFQQQPAGRGHRVLAGDVGDRPGQFLRRALHHLQRDVAGEAVGDDDVDLRRRQVAALDVAGEVDPRRLGEDPVRLDDLRPSLARLLADREQADRRLVHVLHRGGEGGAEEGELDQVLGADLDVGADVEEEHRFPRRRDRHRERRPLHAFEALQAEGGGGHRRPGRAEADHRRGVAVGDVGGGAHHRGLLALAHRVDGVVVVADPFGGRHDLDPLDPVEAERALRAEDPHPDAVGGGAAGALGEYVESLLRPETVEGDRHRAAQRHGWISCRRWSPSGR